MRSIKILHTADVHLDAPYRFLGERGEAQRLQVKKTFEQICHTVVTGKYRLLLISGDLFDSNTVSDRTVSWLMSKLGEIGVPILVCPGTHDRMEPASVYSRGVSGWPPNVHVFRDQEQTSFAPPDMDITVHARPNSGSRSAESPLRDIRRSGPPEAGWEVAMAHGSVVIPGKVENTDFPIRREEIEATGLDYVALGHWHSWGDYSSGKVKAFYPGAPEAHDFGSDKGAVASVILSDKGAVVEKLEIGVRRMMETELSVTGLRDADEIKRRIETLADPELALRVALTGLCDLGLRFEPDELQRELSDKFFHLETVDRSHAALEQISADSFPERLVIGRFVRRMSQRIEEARGDDEKTRLLEDALRLGAALLQGRQVL